MHDRGQEKIDSLLQPVAAGLGYEWVGSELVSHGSDGLLRIYLDKPGGINIDECAKAYQQFIAVLTVEGLNMLYRIEVSSPGLDRPLFTLDHWRQALGKEVKVKLRYPLQARRQWQGLLKSVGDEQITLTVGEEEVEVPLVAVSKANLVPKIEFRKK